MKKRCAAKGCRRFTISRGFCRPHYVRFRRGGDVDRPIRGSPGWAKSRLRSQTMVDPETGCHVWKGWRALNGYGRIKLGGKQISTHRLAWELAKGPIPARMFICHHCDNPACCNPEHLYLGTPADNARDRFARGRTKGARARDLERYPQWR